MRTQLMRLSLASGLLIVCCGLPAAAIDTAEPPGAADRIITWYVPLEEVQQQLELLQQTAQELGQAGQLDEAGHQRLELLLAGIGGQLSSQAVEWGFYPEQLGMGGEVEPNSFYSRIEPSRQVTLFSKQPAASQESSKGLETSYWFDEQGEVFVSQTGAGGEDWHQLNLKEGWEKDYDTLEAQIQQLLDAFLAEHSEEHAESGRP